MNRGPQGVWDDRSETEAHRAFIPNPLPPSPPIEVPHLRERLDAANRALGRLDGISALLPDRRLWLYFYVRKEAVLSSQIEGTQSSLSDLLQFENDAVPGVSIDDVQEVSRSVAATEHALSLMRDQNLPLSSRLIRETHRVLLTDARGGHAQPGAFRRQPVWIGGASPARAMFVPPPHTEVERCIAQLEQFIHAPNVPVLMKAALAHAQFETIHPFLDGNGRVGRLLIALILVAEGALQEPLLYLSLHFRQHRQRYYELLQHTRDLGDWESWFEFFVEGVELTARQAYDTARAGLRMLSEHEATIRALKKGHLSVLAVHQALKQAPIASVKRLTALAGLSVPTTMKGLEALQQLGLVSETTGKKWGRTFAYQPFLQLLANESLT